MCPKTCFALLGVVHKLLHRRWGMGVSLFFDTHKKLIVRGGGGATLTVRLTVNIRFFDDFSYAILEVVALVVAVVLVMVSMFM